MKNLKIKRNPAVENVFKKYPDSVRDKMLALRQLIVETAETIDEIDQLEETLKWGEPSYLSRIGSTIRIDWKEKQPDRYAMYFKCTSKLVSTFREMFPQKFSFEGNRALYFQMDEMIPEAELRACIKAALTYHKVKHLHSLGMI